MKHASRFGFRGMTVAQLKMLWRHLIGRDVSVPPSEVLLLKGLLGHTWGDALTDDLVEQALAARNKSPEYLIEKTLIQETRLFDDHMEIFGDDEVDDDVEIQAQLEALKEK